jgi:predicted acetyltransferase
MTDIAIRTTAPDEYRAASATVSIALLHAPASDDDWAKPAVMPSWEQSDSLSAWEGDACVGHASGYRFDTLVPGGAWLPTSGVTRVGVLATHRRRGVLRALLTRLLQEALDRGQVLASLRASETVIYQRFGFGLAGECAEVDVVPSRLVPINGAARTGSFRLLAHDRILETVKPIYARAARQPGVIDRPDWMWQRYFGNATELGGDGEFVVVHTGADGVDDGFAHYAVKWKTANFTEAAGTGEIYDLWGVDPSVELALWEYLCSIDLVREWYAEERPVDDLVQYATADRRAYRIKHLWDEQWFRLLDVDAALTARSFADHPATFSLAVRDELLPVNDGVWEISAAGAKRTSSDAADADLALDVGTLSALYLGGPRWRALADAGRIDVRDAGAVRTADALFTVPRAPYCCSGF